MARRLSSFPVDPRRKARQDRAAVTREYLAGRPGETKSHVLDELGDASLAADAGLSEPAATATALRHLTHPTAHPKANPVGARRKKRSDHVWTIERTAQAVAAWWNRHGVPPTKMDWSPTRIRYKGHVNAQARLDAFAAGWDGDDGASWPFPRSDRVPFDAALDLARRRRDAL